MANSRLLPSSASSFLLTLSTALLMTGSVPSGLSSEARTQQPPGIDIRRAFSVPQVYPWTLTDERGRSDPARIHQLLALTLASADLDEDGNPDLVAGFSTEGGGLVTVNNGTPNTTSPGSYQAGHGEPGGIAAAVPFLSESVGHPVPVSPDFLAAGDFDGDGHADVVVAERSGAALSLLVGDGTGGFSRLAETTISGAITAMAAGDVNRRDGASDLLVALGGASPPRLLVFESPDGAFGGEPAQIELPAEAVGLAIGNLDADEMPDVAVATRWSVLVVRGRDRRLSSAPVGSRVMEPPQVDRIETPFAVQSVAAGRFSGGQAEGLAILDEYGTARFLSREELAEIVAGRATLDLVEQVKALAPGPMAAFGERALIAVRASGAAHELIAFDRQAGQVRLVSSRRGEAAGTSATFAQEAEGTVVAVLPMRLGRAAGEGLVLLRSGVDRPMAFAPLAFSTTFVVTKTADTNDGSCDTDCSLREAIVAANASAGLDSITFSSGSLPMLPTFSPTSPLPAITEAVAIDGTTVVAGRVELAGSAAGAGANGLTLTGGGSTISGLIVNRFKGHGIAISTNGGNVVQGCTIGLDVTGTVAQANGLNGVDLASGTGNTIGGTTAAARNVIAGNTGTGIKVGAASSGNVILGNWIGFPGIVPGAISNGNKGIWIEGGGTTVGGPAAGMRNVVSGNTAGSGPAGIYVAGPTATGTLIQGNYIGVDPSGAEVLSSNTRGIWIEAGASSTTVGGTTAGAGNLVSGNSSAGVFVGSPTPATGTLVQGNLIGTDATGTKRLGNLSVGIHSYGGVAIGGIAEGAGNTVAFSGKGVVVGGGTGTTILGNSIRSNETFDGNPPIGIDLGNDGASANDPGDADSGPNNLQNSPSIDSAGIDGSGHLVAQYAVDSATTSSAYPLSIEVFWAQASDGQVKSFLAADTWDESDQAAGAKTIDLGLASTIGVAVGVRLTATATDAAGNTSELSVAKGITAGPSTFTVNTADDSGDDVCTPVHCSLREAINAANGNSPHLDTIAFAIPGTPPFTIEPLAPLPVITDPVVLDGTTQAGYSGSPIVELSGETIYNSDGLVISGGASTVRGLVVNRFSNSSAIVLQGPAGSNVIVGNYLGVTVSGLSYAGNHTGVRIASSPSNVIGGPAVGAGNLISGNGIGVSVEGTSPGTVIRGNGIGVNAQGSALGNYTGVALSSSGVVVGGTSPGEGNRISFNSSRAIAVSSGTGNLLRLNVMEGNAFGIDLGLDEATANDAGDPDTGPNNRQNSPVLSSVVIDAGGRLRARYSVDSLPGNSTYPIAVDFYEKGVHPSLQGKAYLGSDLFTESDRAAGVPKDVDLGPAAGMGLEAGEWVVATATDAASNTSEFSGQRIGWNAPATFTVNSTDDLDDGTCDATHCSLREAILTANGNSPFFDTIAFAIPGSAPFTIRPQATLPAITDSVRIDGTTQPGFTGTPVIALDGTDGGTDGLRISSGGSTVRGLAIGNFRGGAGISISGAGSNTIVGNFVGTDTGGQIAAPNRVGILITGSPSNAIGGPTAGDRNLISGNSLYTAGSPYGGVYVTGSGASGNVIRGNSVGTTLDGSAAFPNSSGVRISNAPGTIVGGTGAGEGNVVSGNPVNMDVFGGAGTVVLGNVIGTDSSGSVALGGDTGIRIEGTSPGTKIGGTSSGAGNLISGQRTGIDVASTGVVIQGNRIGPRADGGPSAGNETGIDISGSESTIGGTASGAGNTVSHNGRGISVSNGTRNTIRRNRMEGNGFGIDLPSYSPYPNDPGDSDSGPNNLQNSPVLSDVLLDGSGDLLVTYFVDSSPAYSVYPLFVEFYSSASVAEGQGRDYLGTDTFTALDFAAGIPKVVNLGDAAALGVGFGRPLVATATDSYGNTSEFSAVRGASTGSAVTLVVNTTTDTDDGSCDATHCSLREAINASNGNTARLDQIAFSIPGPGPHTITPVTALPALLEPTILDGTTQPGFAGSPVIEISGLAAPSLNGLTLEGGGSTVRGLAVNGFSAGTGILISGAGSNHVEGNFVGTDSTGSVARPNSRGIVVDGSPYNVIGGLAAGAGNLISGNTLHGVSLTGSATRDNLLQGNTIGLDASGHAKLPNGSGICLEPAAHNNVIGGAVAGAGNLISGNGTGTLIGEFVSGTTIQGNRIGPASDGRGGVGNVVGIRTSSRCSIGGAEPGQSNVISFNEKGVVVARIEEVTVPIVGNRFEGNASIGIDLNDDGPTANDSLDPDAGANKTQNWPVMSDLSVEGSGDLLVSYRVDSQPNYSSYPIRVEFFAADGSENAQGMRLLGSDSYVEADYAIGVKTIRLGSAAALGIGPGTKVVATATDGLRNSSEFSVGEVLVGPPTTFVVTTSDDRDDGACTVAHCSLREAIGLSNRNSPVLDSIHFAIPGSGVRTISPLSALPVVTDPVVIDATTQEGFNGIPLVELDGTGAGDSWGLDVAAGGTTIKGLVVNRFARGGISLSTHGGNAIHGNYLGVDAAGTGTPGGPRQAVGISVTSPSNLLGGPGTGGNVIGGNGAGVRVSGPSATGNVIRGNRIGTNAAGTASVPNTDHGLEVSGPLTTIGGTATGDGNVISSNGGSGIVVRDGAAATLVQGNLIGTDGTGLVTLGNGGHGVDFESSVAGAAASTVGGIVTGARNVISGNAGDGVRVRWGTGHVVEGNSIGTDATGSLALGNGSYGVEVVDAGYALSGIVVRGNFIAGNGAGVGLFNSSGRNSVTGNRIGTSGSGTAALPNSGSGVEILGSPANVIGGSVPEAGNLVSGNRGRGVRITGAASTGNLVHGNRIGTNASGTAPLGNALEGIELNGVSEVWVGGASAGQGNLVSGNGLRGILVTGGEAGNTIQGNLVGTDATGATGMGNASTGIEIGNSAGNRIGGTQAGAGNVVSGNGAVGISLFGAGSSGNVIEGNTVGMNAAGTQAIGNGGSGVEISSAPGNRVGGTLPGARNLISGNRGNGLLLSFGGAVANVVAGNFIGTDVLGTSPIGNRSNGVSVFLATSNTIGGTAAGAGNLVSGNALNGVALSVSGTTGNTIAGNRIGTALDGTNPLGNGLAGVSITSSASNNTVGGIEGAGGNTIAFNGTAGIQADSGLSNRFLRNSFFDNGALAIDLGGDGVTANDHGDLDLGANGLQNHPVLASAIVSGGSTTITGTLDSEPGLAFTIDCFGSPACDASGYGEGRTFLGSASVTTSPDGIATVSSALPVVLVPGSVVTATARADGTGNTSEMSACVVVTQAPPAGARFHPLTPCRVVDTRNDAGPLGGPALEAGQTRSFLLAGSCGIPPDAEAISMNVTAVGGTTAGELTVYPGVGAAPNTSTISFAAGRTRANNAVIGIAGGTQSVLDRQATGTVDLVIDVNGYFR